MRALQGGGWHRRNQGRARGPHSSGMQQQQQRMVGAAPSAAGLAAAARRPRPSPTAALAGHTPASPPPATAAAAGRGRQSARAGLTCSISAISAAPCKSERQRGRMSRCGCMAGNAGRGRMGVGRVHSRGIGRRGRLPGAPPWQAGGGGHGQGPSARTWTRALTRLRMTFSSPWAVLSVPCMPGGGPRSRSGLWVPPVGCPAVATETSARTPRS